MARWVRSCLQSLLKLVNSVVGMVGMGMIIYSLWMLRLWYRQFHDIWSGPDSTPPWFIYTFFGIGVFLCVITCSGHIAAETANGHCLSCAAITADILLNKNWEEDFPEDPTGRFNELKNFVRSNLEMCKWIGLGIMATQAVSIFLSMVLRAFGSDRGSYYDSDDDNVPARLPLLRDHVQHASYVMDPNLRTDSWNIRINEKGNR